ncbi:MAG: hypothetical protein KC583_02770, partial [Myxococcales bacterium]|nr:hypothetical protein [Myxococcales bacterium]
VVLRQRGRGERQQAEDDRRALHRPRLRAALVWPAAVLDWCAVSQRSGYQLSAISGQRGGHSAATSLQPRRSAKRNPSAERGRRFRRDFRLGVASSAQRRGAERRRS